MRADTPLPVAAALLATQRALHPLHAWARRGRRAAHQLWQWLAHNRATATARAAMLHHRARLAREDALALDEEIAYCLHMPSLLQVQARALRVGATALEAQALDIVQRARRL